MLLKLVPVAVPTCDQLVHDVPWHRSTRYCVTPTSSVDAVHDRSIRLALTAVALRPPGIDGAVESVTLGAIAVFMSLWISLAESARLYTRASSISPVKYSP